MTARRTTDQHHNQHVRILDAVRAIPGGLVRTHGDESPEAPTWARRLLAAEHTPDVLWRCVVRADGSPARRRGRLEAESVSFRRARGLASIPRTRMSLSADRALHAHLRRGPALAASSQRSRNDPRSAAARETLAVSTGLVLTLIASHSSTSTSRSPTMCATRSLSASPPRPGERRSTTARRWPAPRSRSTPRVPKALRS
jgi:alkylated DNA nucleotide flippase Atl1